MSARPHLVGILGTPVTLVFMDGARCEQRGNIGDVLPNQKRFLVPSANILSPVFSLSPGNHRFLQLNAPSLTFASGTHWVMLLMPGISTTLVVLQETKARMTPA